MFKKNQISNKKSLKAKIHYVKIASQVLADLKNKMWNLIKVGASVDELDAFAHNFIIKNNCHAAFLGYNGFPKTICVSINQQLIHGIPNNYVLKNEDMITIDVGCIYHGYYADMAFTKIVVNDDLSFNKIFASANEAFEKIDKRWDKELKSQENKEISKPSIIALGTSAKDAKRTTFLDNLSSTPNQRLARKVRLLLVAELALENAIKAIKPNMSLQIVSAIIYRTISQNGYFVPEEYCGHGIGVELHEEPYVGNIPWQSPNIKLKEGMIICVEPMLIEYSKKIKLLNDNWTVVPQHPTALSCHVEHTILVTQEGCEVLTRDLFLSDIFSKFFAKIKNINFDELDKYKEQLKSLSNPNF